LSEEWLEGVAVLDHFAQVADPERYTPLPDDWHIGFSDVVDSTTAIKSGRYKAVNLAGAGTISAVSNALGGALPLFAFGGDGARFAVPPDQAEGAAEALARASAWSKRDLDLQLRVGMTTMAEVRMAGKDVRAAFWRASNDVRYAMFTGGGLEWAEAEMKRGRFRLTPADPNDEPDLTGLSCQWGPIQPKQGKIVSLIVRRGPEATDANFGETTSEVIALLEDAASLNPVPAAGPDVRWPSASIGLQSKVAQDGRGAWARRLRVFLLSAFMWSVFKFSIRIGTFRPDQYREEVAANTDFRKFDDALMMTVDCAPETVTRLRQLLDSAVAKGTVRYGLHMQDEALMTCVVPSVLNADHMHFVDGAGGGYASAAQQLRD